MELQSVNRRPASGILCEEVTAGLKGGLGTAICFLFLAVVRPKSQCHEQPQFLTDSSPMTFTATVIAIGVCLGVAWAIVRTLMILAMQKIGLAITKQN